MLTKLTVVLLIVMLCVGISVERAVQKTEIRSIAEVKAADTVGGTVAVRGTITLAQGNTFSLRDRSGTAELWTCPTWYKTIDLHEGDCVTVVGQVVRDKISVRKPDIILSVYKIISGSDVISIRERPGRPRWTYPGSPSTGHGEQLAAL
jgi:uncharacterized protein YdeI (BOF family)